MTRIVEVRHPAPMRYVPAGKRKELFGFAAVRTPVELNEADPGEVGHVARVAIRDGLGAIDVYAHGGRYWTRLASRKSPGGLADEPRAVPRADFLSHLERASANPWADLHGYFARTPLCAVREDPVRHGADRNPDAGRDLGLDGARIVHDGSEQARRDIVRFLDRDVLLAGNEAYVRLVGPLAFRGARSRTRFELTRHPRSRAAHVSVDAEVCRLDRIPRYVGLLGGDPGELEVHNGEGWDGLEPGMMGDDDILLMANDIPRRVLAAYSMLEGRRDELGNAAVDALAGLRQQVAGWRLRGMTGSIMEDEVEAALVDALALAKDVRALLVGRSPDLERLVHYIEDFALPCLRDPMPLPEEDVEAMRGLAP